MPSFVSPSLLQSPVAALVATVLLAMIGAAAIDFVLRQRRRAIAARLRLIAPWTTSDQPPAGAPSRADWTPDSVSLTLERIVRRALQRFAVPVAAIRLLVRAMRPIAALCLCIATWLVALWVISPSAGPVLPLAFAAVGAILGWFVPLLAEQVLETRYRNAVVAGLPDALELLVICSEGGLALADGIERVGRKLYQARPELADEFARISADLKILPSQEDALARFATRIDRPVARSLVASLSQTMRYGTPMAEAMRVVAAELRNEALLTVKERVNRLPALLTVPMIIFILPTILLVAGGPAALKTIDVLFH